MLRGREAAPTATVRDTLARVRRAHEKVGAEECPSVRASDLDAAVPWLALAVDPLGTAEDLCARWPSRTVPYAEAIVLTHALARFMAGAHAAGECLGSLSPEQIVIDRSGAFRVLGLGFGGHAESPRAYCAPRVAMGMPPTPSSDVHAGILFLRAHIRWVASVPEPLAHLLEGRRGDGRFAGVIRDALLESARVDGGVALEALERFWALLGVRPDVEAMGRRLRATFVGAAVQVDVAHDFSWLSVGGGPRHDLARREPARRVLRALLAARGATVSIDALVASAWPGEALVGSSGTDRVYVAISTLRGLGLRPAIVRERGGYALRVAATYHEPVVALSGRARAR